MDVDNVPPGVDFIAQIERTLDEANVLLVVIGRDWLSPDDRTGQPRLADEDDPVRLEIRLALDRSQARANVGLIPVLVGGARMPRHEELPDELKPLARLNAITLTHEHWHRDTTLLMASLDAIVEVERPKHHLRGGPARDPKRVGGRRVEPNPRASRGRVAAGLATLVAVVAGLTAILAGGGEAVRIGAVTGEPTVLGSSPTAIAGGTGAVWVAGCTTKSIMCAPTDGGTVTALDPRSGRVRTGPRRVGRVASGIVVGGGAVWATGNGDDSLYRLDARTAQPLGRPIRVGQAPRDVAFGYGDVWTANYGSSEYGGSISRVDPGTRQVHTLRVDGNPTDIAVGAGAVWVPVYQRGTLLRINPVSDRVTATITLGTGSPESVTFGAGRVWVGDIDHNLVVEVDPNSDQAVGAPIQVGARPDDLALWRGGVYVANQNAGTVSRIDTRTHRVSRTSLSVGNRPDALTVYDGRLWVANFGSQSVVRVRG